MRHRTRTTPLLLLLLVGVIALPLIPEASADAWKRAQAWLDEHLPA